MRGSERDGTTWQEETISELVWQAARPEVMYAPFTKREEPSVGADWLWWWIDLQRNAFGMLVQAKRLKRRPSDGSFTIEFDYKNGEQMARLFKTSDMFDVPATYVLYMGSPEFRGGVGCTEHSVDCERCHRSSISVLTALQADFTRESPRDAATEALIMSIPLEDLVDQERAPTRISDLNMNAADSELRKFLMEGQSGARRVARKLFSGVADDRMRVFTAAQDERQRIGDAAMFTDLPLDYGHFRRPYYPHVLRGLRTAPRTMSSTHLRIVRYPLG